MFLELLSLYFLFYYLCRTTPELLFDQIAIIFKKLKIESLIIVGGFEVFI